MQGSDEDYFTIGYRYGEVDLPDPVPVNERVKIRDRGIIKRARTQLARSLPGGRIRGITPPIADATDQESLFHAAKYRFARAQKKASPERLADLKAFTRKFCEKHLNPIPAGEINFEDYISGTHYSAKKKNVFRLMYETMVWVAIKIIYKSFGKVEHMKDGTKYKHCRCINPPPDEWKIYASPYIHAVEKQVCKLSWFAKYVPVVMRPQYILELFQGRTGPYYVTDYTSFESSITPEIYDATEGEMYRYMLMNYPEAALKINTWNTSEKECKFRDFSIKIPGVRMSGDPNTSLGNGFVNLVVMAYNCDQQDAQFVGCVEGDDGLFCFDKDITFDLQEEMGFQLKAESHDTIQDTSFCGLMLSRSLAAFSDPRTTLAAFGWSHSALRNGGWKTRMGLLRSKALSLLYCNPRCPILTAFAKRYIALTQGYTEVLSDKFWDQKIIQEKATFSEALELEMAKGISYEDRLDFDHLYNISPQDQLEIEEAITRLQLGVIDSEVFDSLYGVDFWVYRDFDNKFCGSAIELGLA